ncbi:VTT domain-containing protein [Patescibacteria group bacterium]|nr:VTT domain-containing protein [Patescibacteria group bacterium]
MIFEIIIYIFTVSLATIIPTFIAVPIELAMVPRYSLPLTFIFTMIGNVLGAIVAYLIAKKFGWPIIEKLFSDKQIKKAKGIVNKYTFGHIVWSRMIFAGISDVLSFVCGLTEITLGKFIISTIIADIPSTFIILAFGNQLDLNFVFTAWITVGILLVSIILMTRQLMKSLRLEKFGK